MLIFHHKVVKAGGQSATYTQSQHFGIGGEEQNRALILNKSAIVTFLNENDKNLFSQARKMILLETRFENYGEEKGNGFTSFNQKEI